MTSFTDLGLDAGLLKALAAEGYTVPTPIQAQAIPVVMTGRDLLGIAQTGTGKTAAFALPILHRLAANRRPAQRKGCRVLVLSPTRELATQIAESMRTYGRHLGLSVAVVFGGVAHRPQQQALERGVDILVATPGRLLDHMGERNVALSGTEVLVLDEADQMLDLGFIVPIRRIVRELSQRRQSLFFSATMPNEIGKLAGELLRDPVRVAVAPVATTVERVDQRVIHVEQNRKVSVLAELFADPAMSRALVFTRTKRGADRVARRLEMLGVPVAAIHGNKSQRQRERALEDFKRARIRALVATDIAARGIDIDQVTHVVNFELPNIPESYVHRIGRTARAGAAGIAISLCDGEERAYLRDIERLTRQQIPATDRRNDQRLEADPPRRAGGHQARHGHDAHRQAGGPRRDQPHGRPARFERNGRQEQSRDDRGRPERGDGRAPVTAANGHHPHARPHAQHARHDGPGHREPARNGHSHSGHRPDARDEGRGRPEQRGARPDRGPRDGDRRFARGQRARVHD